MSFSGEGQTFALVAYGPAKQGRWKLEPVIPRALEEDEVLVKIVGSGICLADIHAGDTALEDAAGTPWVWYPRVLGHEGSGYVEDVGGRVKAVKPSDPVILTFLTCGECDNCQDGHPAYCLQSFEDNFLGQKGVYARWASPDDFDIGGLFFGQSSFASRAIVKERCVVNLVDMDVTEEELKILAPLGCGVQTGAGCFTNIADVQPGFEVAVLGVGGVGQSAIMAAAMRKCKTIIAIDRSSDRLRLAESLGATHLINTTDSRIDLVSEVKKITEGQGVQVSLDTTGVQSLARQSWDFVRKRGKILQVGLAEPAAKWDIPMADHMNSGKQIIGCVEGDVVPENFIPEMINWYRAGKFPVNKIISLYAAKEYGKALEDMRHGTAVKPVLVWTDC